MAHKGWSFHSVCSGGAGRDRNVSCICIPFFFPPALYSLPCFLPRKLAPRLSRFLLPFSPQFLHFIPLLPAPFFRSRFPPPRSTFLRPCELRVPRRLMKAFGGSRTDSFPVLIRGLESSYFVADYTNHDGKKSGYIRASFSFLFFFLFFYFIPF